MQRAFLPKATTVLPWASSPLLCSGQRASQGCGRGARPRPNSRKSPSLAPKPLILLCLGHPQRRTEKGWGRTEARAHRGTGRAQPPHTRPLTQHLFTHLASPLQLRSAPHVGPRPAPPSLGSQVSAGRPDKKKMSSHSATQALREGASPRPGPRHTPQPVPLQRPAPPPRGAGDVHSGSGMQARVGPVSYSCL